MLFPVPRALPAELDLSQPADELERSSSQRRTA
jgi:hypothetical protein